MLGVLGHWALRPWAWRLVSRVEMRRFARIGASSQNRLLVQPVSQHQPSPSQPASTSQAQASQHQPSPSQPARTSQAQANQPAPAKPRPASTSQALSPCTAPCHPSLLHRCGGSVSAVRPYRRKQAFRQVVPPTILSVTFIIQQSYAACSIHLTLPANFGLGNMADTNCETT